MAILESWFAPFRRVKGFLSPPAPHTTEAPNETIKLNCQIDELNRKVRWIEEANVQLEQHNKRLKRNTGLLYKHTVELEECVELLIRTTAITKSMGASHSTAEDETDHSISPILHRNTSESIHSRNTKPMTRYPDSAPISITNNTIRVLDDKPPLMDQTCAPSLSLTKPRYLKLKACFVGMIGWHPIFRSSIFTSGSDLQTDFGPVCAKRYPLIIVDVLPDCMMAVLISTAGGDGLRKKPQSIRDRSIHVVKAGSCTGVVPDHGKWLGTRVALAVRDSSGYYPPEGAFVDMLNTFQVLYGSRFERTGQLTSASTLQLVEMRRSAVLACSKAAIEKYAKHGKWVVDWRQIGDSASASGTSNERPQLNANSSKV